MKKLFNYLTYFKLLWRKFYHDGLRMRDWDELDRVNNELFGKPYLAN